jgi:hypothetical protein
MLASDGGGCHFELLVCYPVSFEFEKENGTQIDADER